MPATKPNILLIVTDHQRGDALGIEGHPVLQTPIMDWIGTSGAYFRRAYTECPSCSRLGASSCPGRRPLSTAWWGWCSIPNGTRPRPSPANCAASATRPA
ncbi:MAG: sulfatase-like hydrolase/transferase [Actinobacteria bacterium]|nr:sulfatase-like hydrolase/transferase [Actinomycetota bacterium]